MTHLLHAIGGQLGTFDLPCPRCGPDRKAPANRRRKVLRVWHDEPGFLTYTCARCGWSGWERAEGGSETSRRREVVASPASATDDAARRDMALAIWHEAVPPIGTPVAAYMKARGLWLHDDVLAADVLRYHPTCPFGRARLPTMLALLRDIRTDEPRAIHRTAIRPDGSGKASPPDGGPAKRMLGPAGGAVAKLTGDEHITQGLGIAEGLETALTALCAGFSPMWAAGSAGAIRFLLVLPGVEALTIFADADENGEGQQAARACARRWADAGCHVTLLLPPRDGIDWNDWLREETAA